MLCGPDVSWFCLKVSQSCLGELAQGDNHGILHQTQPVLNITSGLHLLHTHREREIQYIPVYMYCIYMYIKVYIHTCTCTYVLYCMHNHVHVQCTCIYIQEDIVYNIPILSGKRYALHTEITLYTTEGNTFPPHRPEME